MLNRSSHVRRIITALVAALLVAGCAAQQLPPGAVDPRVERFVADGWLVGIDTASVETTLGPPATVVTTKTKNRHQPKQVDSLLQWRYPGLALDFYRVNEKPPRELPVQVTVTDPRYELMYGLRVGSTRRRVERALGTSFSPLSRAEQAKLFPKTELDCDDSPCSYRYMSGPQEVYFLFRDGRVTRIDWIFAVD
ncbi:MAG: hypothetical protein ABR538_06805 [Candidatus Binatia bacterium]